MRRAARGATRPRPAGRPAAPALLEAYRAHAAEDGPFPYVDALAGLRDAAALAEMARLDPRNEALVLDRLVRLGPEAAPAVPLIIGWVERRGYLVEESVRALGAIGRGATAALPALERIRDDGADRSGIPFEAANAVSRIRAPLRPPPDPARDRRAPILALDFDERAGTPGVRGGGFALLPTPTALLAREAPLPLEEGFTIALWFRSKGAGARFLVSDVLDLSVVTNGYVWWHTAYTDGHKWGQGCPLRKGNAIDGAWHHLAVVHDPYARELRPYLDGAQTGGGASFANERRGDPPHDPIVERSVRRALRTVTLGGQVAPGSDVAVDEVRVWDRALTKEEVAALARAP